MNSRTKSRLNGLGINTLEDLIHHFPHRHDDFTDVRKISQVVPGETQTVKATIWEVSETGRGRVKNAQAILGDETGNIRVIWFNQGYLVRTLKPGTSIVISGEAKVYRGRVVFQSPEYDFVDDRDEQMHAGRLVPIYPLTDGLYQSHGAPRRQAGAGCDGETDQWNTCRRIRFDCTIFRVCEMQSGNCIIRILRNTRNRRGGVSPSMSC